MIRVSGSAPDSSEAVPVDDSESQPSASAASPEGEPPCDPPLPVLEEVVDRDVLHLELEWPRRRLRPRRETPLLRVDTHAEGHWTGGPHGGAHHLTGLQIEPEGGSHQAGVHAPGTHPDFLEPDGGLIPDEGDGEGVAGQVPVVRGRRVAERVEEEPDDLVLVPPEGEDLLPGIEHGDGSFSRGQFLGELAQIGRVPGGVQARDRDTLLTPGPEHEVGALAGPEHPCAPGLIEEGALAAEEPAPEAHADPVTDLRLVGHDAFPGGAPDRGTILHEPANAGGLVGVRRRRRDLGRPEARGTGEADEESGDPGGREDDGGTHGAIHVMGSWPRGTDPPRHR